MIKVRKLKNKIRKYFSKNSIPYVFDYLFTSSVKYKTDFYLHQHKTAIEIMIGKNINEKIEVNKKSNYRKDNLFAEEGITVLRISLNISDDDLIKVLSSFFKKKRVRVKKLEAKDIN